MSTTTAILGLVKPSISDAVSLTDIDENFEKIDDAVGELNTAIANAGGANGHVWSRNTCAIDFHTSVNTNSILFAMNSTRTIYYSDSYTISGTNFVLTNPTSITVDSNSSESVMNPLKGKYSMMGVSTASTMNMFPSDATFSKTYDGNYCITVSSYTVCSNVRYVYTLIDYLVSSNVNAYPPTPADEYTYFYLGQIGGKVACVHGTYVGTGTYGYTDRNIINFENIIPKIIIVYDASSSSFLFAPYLSKGQFVMEGGNSANAHATWAEGEFTWCHTSSAASQFNNLESIYDYYILY